MRGRIRRRISYDKLNTNGSMLSNEHKRYWFWFLIFLLFVSTIILMILYFLPRFTWLITTASKIPILMTIWRLVITELYFDSILLTLKFARFYKKIVHDFQYYTKGLDLYFNLILFIISAILVMMWPMTWLASVVYIYHHSNYSFIINLELTQIASWIVFYLFGENDAIHCLKFVFKMKKHFW